MNKNLQQFNFFHSYYPVDKQMVPCTEKNSKKQTIWKKTVRFGYRNFIMCSDNGYPYFIDPYCGSNSGQNKPFKNLYSGSVIHCVSEIDDWSDKEGFFDNWFSSLFIIKVLRDQGKSATGTVRADKLGSLIINKFDIKKQERVTRNTFYEKNGILLSLWMIMVQ